MYNQRNANVSLINHIDKINHLPPLKSWPEGSKVCSACRSAFEGQPEGGKTANRIILCPECKRRKNEEIPSGYIYIKGDFLIKHYKDLELLVKNEARRAERENPADKIMERIRSKSQITIATTTEELAERLGCAIERAFGGETCYDFSPEKRLTRVWWKRD